MFGFFEDDEDKHHAVEHAAHGESWLARTTHLLHAAEESKLIPHGQISHGWGKALPWIGAAHGLISGGLNAKLAADEFSEHGLHSDKAWDHVGGAYLGAAGATLSATGSPYAAPLALGEVLTDVAGSQAKNAFGEDAGFTADSVVGSWIRGTMGDESTGWQAGEAVSDVLGGGALGTGAGVVAGIGTGMITMPYDMAATATSGLYGEAAAIGQGIWNGEGWVGEGVHNARDGIMDAFGGMFD